MYDKTILLEILLDDSCRILDNDGKPYTPNTSVYATISQKMQERGSKITPKHVYTIIKENRNGYKDILLKHLGIQSSVEEKLDSTGNSENTNMDTSDASSIALHSRTFNIIVSADKWLLMKPIKKIYKNRVYWVLQPGWTDIIAEKIWQQQKLDCVFKFKKHRIHLRSDARCYVFFRGSCIKCSAIIECMVLKKPTENTDVIFPCKVKDICYTKHINNKKRHLKGIRRKVIADKMIKERADAVTFRREEAKRLKVFGDKDPPILPSSAVLRKAKEERLLKQHGLVFSNPVLNLLNSAKCSTHTGSIISIGLLPFYCIYWTSEQKMLYTERCKRDAEAFLTIDATGGIIKRGSSQDPPIFLYQCVLVSKSGSTPVFQMISADHRALMIAFFLRNIIAAGVPVPRTVVSDFGWAILIAVSDVFAKCVNFQDYLRKCFAAAVLKNIDLTPFCYIRLDVCHLISMVSKWKCLKGKDKTLVRAFYLRCISQAYLMDSFKELEYFMESLLSVALSKSIGSTNNGETLRSDVRMQYLNSIIKGSSAINDMLKTIENKTDENPNDNETERCSDDFSEHETDDTDWKEWSVSVLNSSKKIAEDSRDGSIINACYNPDFAEQVRVRLLPYLPIWTGVMRPVFKRSGEIAASSCVEAEFSDLKNRCFKGQLPIKVDKFVIQHLNFLDKKIMLASNEEDIPMTDDVSSQNNGQIKNLLPDQYSNAIKIETADYLRKSEIVPEKRKISEVCTDESYETSFINSSESIIPSIKNVSNPEIDAISNSTFMTECDSNGVDSSAKDNSNDVASSAKENSNDLMDTDKSHCWNISENWHGLVSSITNEPDEVPIKKRAKPSYLDKCPEWDYLKNIKSFNLPLIMNGNKCGPVKIEKSTMTLQDTCAFDSLLQLVASGIATHAAYRNAVESSDDIFRLAKSLLEDGRILSKHYYERVNILKNLPLFRDSIKFYTRSIKRLNVNCNVAHLADYLFENEPSCTITTTCTCGVKESRQTITLNINVDILLQEGLQHMQRAINDSRNKNSICCKCGILKEHCITYGNHIIIDASIFTDYRYNNRRLDLKHTLNSIAKVITLGDINYILTGVVHYIQYDKKNNGHYIAFALTGTRWYKYDDLNKKREIANCLEEIRPHVIIYVKQN